MIENSLRYLVVSDNESLNALLNAEFGEIVQYVDELELVDTYVQKYWPNAIIIDIETTQASAEWFYSLRQQFPIAEIPLIIFQQQVDTVFEQQMSHLNRVSILSESDLQAVTTFVEILMDEYVRDPFYERESQLVTLERVAQMWLHHNCAQIYYTRYMDDYSPEEGHRIHLVHGGVRTPLVLNSLKQMLRDPRPVVEVEENSQYLGDWLNVGELLFEEIKMKVKPGFLRIRQWFALTPNPELGAIAKDLPITIQTRRLLQQDHTWHSRSIHDRIAELEIRNTQVEIDIEILVRLGLYQLKTTELQDTQSNISADLPYIAPDNWHAFLLTVLKEQIDRFNQPNPWKAWGWNVQDSVVQQSIATRANWSIFDELSSIDAQDLLRQLHDEMDSLVRRIEHWQQCFTILGQPPENEEAQFWLAIGHLERLNPTAAKDVLTNCAHPIPRAIYLWLQFRSVIKSPTKIRPILIEMSEIAELGFLPLIEVYMAVLHMAMGHWPQAIKRLKTLPSSHQTRSLLWNCQQRTLDLNSWVFWQI